MTHPRYLSKCLIVFNIRECYGIFSETFTYRVLPIPSPFDNPTKKYAKLLKVSTEMLQSLCVVFPMVIMWPWCRVIIVCGST